MTEAVKRCTLCRESKPLSAFNNAKRAKDGKASRCRECARADQRAVTASTAERQPCRCDCGQLAPRGRKYVAGHRGELPLRVRLFSRLVFDSASDCLLWTGSTNKGYGRVSVDGRPREVHIVMWEMFEGRIPDGYELDHVKECGCTNKHCASIAHLEPVTHGVNLLRADRGFGAQNYGKTHCLRDHEYTPENTYITVRPSGGISRSCKECRRDYRARRAAA